MTFVLKSLAVLWAIATTIGVLALLCFFVVLPGLAFLAALLERQHLRPIVRLPPGHNSTVPTQVRNLISAAEARDYRQIGDYTAHLGLVRARITLLLRADSQTLLLLTHDRSGPQLITGLNSGQWVLTGSTLPDLCGLDEVELVDGDFEAVDARHHDRLTTLETEISTFDPNTLECDILEHMREQVRRLQAIGLVRYLDPDRASWIYTAKGAWRLTRAAVAKVNRLDQDGSLTETEAKVQGFRRRRVVQRFAMLQAFWLLPGSAAFEAAFPEWVAAFPAWVDSAVVTIFTLSVVALFVSGFAGFRCPVCKTSLSDDDGSLLLFSTIEVCDSCGTPIDAEDS